MKTIDLHTHSTCSDGSMTPAELMRHAKESGLAAVALTDHDCVDGLEEAKNEAERIGIEFIPGVELSVTSSAETHIVGLFIDPEEPELKKALEKIRLERKNRNAVTSSLLKAAGMDVSVEEAKKEAGSDLVARAHFAKVMVKKGYAESAKDAFERFLGPGKPCFAPVAGLDAKEGIELIKNAGGTAVAAHLHHTKKEGAALEKYLRELKGWGLDAVEGFYSEYTPQMTGDYIALAGRLGLAISGGTDFHGSMKPHIAIGKGFGDMAVPYALLEELKRRAGIS
ncbi:MAG: PHP domain-containing protein [Clostridia bacterium]|nr:PHP domain-containing protein [Clostridia bacterium]